MAGRPGFSCLTAIELIELRRTWSEDFSSDAADWREPATGEVKFAAIFYNDSISAINTCRLGRLKLMLGACSISRLHPQRFSQRMFFKLLLVRLFAALPVDFLERLVSGQTSASRRPH